MKPSHALRTSVNHWGTHRRLHAEKGKRLRNVLVEGFRCQLTVLVPLDRRSVDLRLGSPCYLDFHGLVSRVERPALQAPLRPKLFPRDRLRLWPEATPLPLPALVSRRLRRLWPER